MDHIERMDKIREVQQVARANRRQFREDHDIHLPLRPQDWRAKKKVRRCMARRSRRINRQRRH